MTITTVDITYHFPPEFDERAEYEMTLKGYLCGGEVELTDGRRLPGHLFRPNSSRPRFRRDGPTGEPAFIEPAARGDSRSDPRRYHADAARTRPPAVLRPLQAGRRFGGKRRRSLAIARSRGVAMPVHDWSLLVAWAFHDLHLAWVADLQKAAQRRVASERILRSGRMSRGGFAHRERVTKGQAADHRGAARQRASCCRAYRDRFARQ